MENISYEDFTKLDIRVGTIKKVKEHPDADKLLILLIDEGNVELRQLIAGLKEYHKPEDLIDKQVVFIANLEPRELRGETSNGMILAAVEGDSLSILTTDRKVPDNAKVQ